LGSLGRRIMSSREEGKFINPNPKERSRQRILPYYESRKLSWSIQNTRF
jgi:hypothetical protein